MILECIHVFLLTFLYFQGIKQVAEQNFTAEIT